MIKRDISPHNLLTYSLPVSLFFTLGAHRLFGSILVFPVSVVMFLIVFNIVYFLSRKTALLRVSTRAKKMAPILEEALREVTTKIDHIDENDLQAFVWNCEFLPAMRKMLLGSSFTLGFVAVLYLKNSFHIMTMVSFAVLFYFSTAHLLTALLPEKEFSSGFFKKITT